MRRKTWLENFTEWQSFWWAREEEEEEESESEKKGLTGMLETSKLPIYIIVLSPFI